MHFPDFIFAIFIYNMYIDLNITNSISTSKVDLIQHWIMALMTSKNISSISVDICDWALLGCAAETYTK